MTTWCLFPSLIAVGELCWLNSHLHSLEPNLHWFARPVYRVRLVIGPTFVVTLLISKELNGYIQFTRIRYFLSRFLIRIIYRSASYFTVLFFTNLFKSGFCLFVITLLITNNGVFNFLQQLLYFSWFCNLSIVTC